MNTEMKETVIEPTVPLSSCISKKGKLFRTPSGRLMKERKQEFKRK